MSTSRVDNNRSSASGKNASGSGAGGSWPRHRAAQSGLGVVAVADGCHKEARSRPVPNRHRPGTWGSGGDLCCPRRHAVPEGLSDSCSSTGMVCLRACGSAGPARLPGHRKLFQHLLFRRAGQLFQKHGAKRSAPRCRNARAPTPRDGGASGGALPSSATAKQSRNTASTISDVATLNSTRNSRCNGGHIDGGEPAKHGTCNQHDQQHHRHHRQAMMGNRAAA